MTGVQTCALPIYNDGIIFAALGFVDGRSVRQFQFSQVLQRIFSKAAAKVDDDDAGPNTEYSSDLSVVYSLGNKIAFSIIQKDVVVVFICITRSFRRNSFPPNVISGLPGSAGLISSRIASFNPFAGAAPSEWNPSGVDRNPRRQIEAGGR